MLIEINKKSARLSWFKDYKRDDFPGMGASEILKMSQASLNDSGTKINQIHMDATLAHFIIEQYMEQERILGHFFKV